MIDPENTARLKLPYIMPSQAQKHVTHNEAIRLIDALVQPGVKDRDLAAPPAEPAEGDQYIVAQGAAGEWAGKEDHLAAFMDGAWFLLPPVTGMLAYVADEARLIAWDGSTWRDAAAQASQNLAMLGVGTTADATNPFTAKLESTLWTAKTINEGGSGDLRYKLNKEAAGNTLSCLFQTAFSGRAELGLVGDDDFSLKVSPDGSAWTEAMRAGGDTGAMGFPEHPKFSAYSNFDNYVAADSWATIAMNNAHFNDQGDFDAGTSAFTAPHDGYYVFGAGYHFKENSAVPDVIHVGLGINGANPTNSNTEVQGDAMIVTIRSKVNITRLLKLSAGDTVEAMAYMAANDGYVRADWNHFFGYQVP
ncbi:DUF2793 domain-containing protein [Chelativorans alearense]|uniref:DUF2793 domain-containing protein n=1 Tax=Chelativorans alearense TaxID=2681495 RepID=UPI0013D1809B|nr:DUF2793 domain-containing protein [Chelativorans alearense]